MPRVVLDRLELAQKFLLTIGLAFARHSGIRSDLLNPRETENAERRRDFAAYRLAEFLADKFMDSKHEVTRERLDGDNEELLARLREKSAERRNSDGE